VLKQRSNRHLGAKKNDLPASIWTLGRIVQIHLGDEEPDKGDNSENG